MISTATSVYTMALMAMTAKYSQQKNGKNNRRLLLTALGTVLSGPSGFAS
jgi:hypothetical protein